MSMTLSQVVDEYLTSNGIKKEFLRPILDVDQVSVPCGLKVNVNLLKNSFRRHTNFYLENT